MYQPTVGYQLASLEFNTVSQSHYRLVQLENEEVSLHSAVYHYWSSEISAKTSKNYYLKHLPLHMLVTQDSINIELSTGQEANVFEAMVVQSSPSSHVDVNVINVGELMSA